MQDSKDQESIKDKIEFSFWKYLKALLGAKGILNDAIKVACPGFTWQELPKAQLFNDPASIASSTNIYPRRPKDFENLEFCLKNRLSQDKLSSLTVGLKLLIYCTFKKTLKTLEIKFASSFPPDKPPAESKEKEKKTFSSFHRWGDSIISPMAEALANAPDQDPIQVLIKLAEQRVIALTPAPLESKISRPSNIPTFTSGPLIDAMNQPVLVDPSPLQSVDEFIQQFWRDANVSWGKDYKQFETRHNAWLKPIVTKMLATAQQPASGKQPELFGKLKFLYKHLRDDAYPNMALTLPTSQESYCEVTGADGGYRLTITQVYTHYQLPQRRNSSLPEQRPFTMPIWVVAEMTITNPKADAGSVLTQSDFFQEERIISVSISQEDAALLKLRERYFPEWFQADFERYSQHITALEKQLVEDFKKLTALLTQLPQRSGRRGSESTPIPSGIVEAVTDEDETTLLNRYIGQAQILEHLARAAGRAEKYGVTSSIKQRAEQLHMSYWNNMQLCLRIHALRRPDIAAKTLLRVQSEQQFPRTITLKKDDFEPLYCESLRGEELLQKKAAGSLQGQAMTRTQGIEGLSRVVSRYVMKRNETGVMSESALKDVLKGACPLFFNYEQQNPGIINNHMFDWESILKDVLKNFDISASLIDNPARSFIEVKGKTVKFTTYYERIKIPSVQKGQVLHAPIVQCIALTITNMETLPQVEASFQISVVDATYLKVKDTLVVGNANRVLLEAYEQQMFTLKGEQFIDAKPTMPTPTSFADEASCCEAFLRAQQTPIIEMLEGPASPFEVKSSPGLSMLLGEQPNQPTVASEFSSIQHRPVRKSSLAGKTVDPAQIVEKLNGFSWELRECIKEQFRPGSDRTAPSVALWMTLFTWWPKQVGRHLANVNRVVVSEEGVGTILTIEYMLAESIWPVIVRFDITDLATPVVLDVTMHSKQVLQFELANQAASLISHDVRQQARQELLIWRYLLWHLGTAYTRGQAFEQAQLQENAPEYRHFIEQFARAQAFLSKEEGLLLYGIFKASEKDVTSTPSSPQTDSTPISPPTTISVSPLPRKERAFSFSGALIGALSLSRTTSRETTETKSSVLSMGTQPLPFALSPVLTWRVMQYLTSALRNRVFLESAPSNSSSSTSTLPKATENNQVTPAVGIVEYLRKVIKSKIKQLDEVFTTSLLSLPFKDTDFEPENDMQFPLLEQTQLGMFDVTRAFRRAETTLLKDTDSSGEVLDAGSFTEKSEVIRDLRRYVKPLQPQGPMIIIGGQPFVLPSDISIKDLLAAFEARLQAIGVPLPLTHHIIKNLHQHSGGYGALFNAFFSKQLLEMDIRISALNTAKLHIDYNKARKVVTIRQEACTSSISLPFESKPPKKGVKHERQTIQVTPGSPGKTPFVLGLGGICRITLKNGRPNYWIEAAFVTVHDKAQAATLEREVVQKFCPPLGRTSLAKKVSEAKTDSKRGPTATLSPGEELANLQQKLKKDQMGLLECYNAAKLRELMPVEQGMVDKYLANPRTAVVNLVENSVYEKLLVVAMKLDLSRTTLRDALYGAWHVYQENYQRCWHIYAVQKENPPSEQSLQKLLFWHHVRWWSFIFTKTNTSAKPNDVPQFLARYPTITQRLTSHQDLLCYVFTGSWNHAFDSTPSSSVSTTSTQAASPGMFERAKSLVKLPKSFTFSKPKKDMREVKQAQEIEDTELSPATPIDERTHYEKEVVGGMVDALKTAGADPKWAGENLVALAQTQGSKLLQELFSAESLHVRRGHEEDFIKSSMVAFVDIADQDVQQNFISADMQFGEGETLQDFYQQHKVLLSRLADQILDKQLTRDASLYHDISAEEFVVQHRYQGADFEYPVYLRLELRAQDKKINIHWTLTISQGDALIMDVHKTHMLFPTSPVCRALCQLSLAQITVSADDWRRSFESDLGKKESEMLRVSPVTKPSLLPIWRQLCFGDADVDTVDKQITYLNDMLRQVSKLLSNIWLYAGNMRIIEQSVGEKILAVYYTQWQAQIEVDVQYMFNKYKEKQDVFDHPQPLLFPIEVQFNLKKLKELSPWLKPLQIKFFRDYAFWWQLQTQIKTNSPLKHIALQPAAGVVERFFWQQLHHQLIFKKEAWQVLNAPPAEEKQVRGQSSLAQALYTAVSDSEFSKMAYLTAEAEARQLDAEEAEEVAPLVETASVKEDQKTIQLTFMTEGTYRHKSIGSTDPAEADVEDERASRLSQHTPSALIDIGPRSPEPLRDSPDSSAPSPESAIVRPYIVRRVNARRVSMPVVEMKEVKAASMSDLHVDYVNQQMQEAMSRGGDLQQNLLTLAVKKAHALEPALRIEIPMVVPEQPLPEAEEQQTTTVDPTQPLPKARVEAARMEATIREFWGDMGTIVHNNEPVTRDIVVNWAKEKQRWFDGVMAANVRRALGSGNIVKPYWSKLNEMVARKTRGGVSLELTKELIGVSEDETAYVVENVVGFSHYHTSTGFFYSTVAPVELFLTIRFNKQPPETIRTQRDVFTVQARLHISQQDAQAFFMPYALPVQPVDTVPFAFSAKNENFTEILRKRVARFPQFFLPDTIALNKLISLFKDKEIQRELASSLLSTARLAEIGGPYLALPAKPDQKEVAQSDAKGYLKRLLALSQQHAGELADEELMVPAIQLSEWQSLVATERQRLIYTAYQSYGKTRQLVLQAGLAKKALDTTAYSIYLNSYLEKTFLSDEALKQCAAIEQRFWQQLQWRLYMPEYAIYVLFEPLLLAADGRSVLPEKEGLEAMVRQEEDYRRFIRLFPFSQFNATLQLQLYCIFMASFYQATADEDFSPTEKEVAKRLALQQLVTGLIAPPYGDLQRLEDIAAKCLSPLLPQTAPREGGLFSGTKQGESKKETKADKASKTRHVFCTDFDGCFGYLPDAKAYAKSGSLLNRGKDILAYQQTQTQNKGWLSYVTSSINIGDNLEATIILGSSRSNLDKDLEQIYSISTRADSSYFCSMRTFVSEANTFLRRESSAVSLTLDEFLMADIAYQLSPGRSFANAILYYGENPQRLAKGPLLPRVENDFIIDDPEKVFLVYANMQREALKTPYEDVICHVVDDSLPILQGLRRFFELHLEWVPKNVTLRLVRCAPLVSAETRVVGEDIVGCGEIAADYAQTVRQRAGLLRDLRAEIERTVGQDFDGGAIKLLTWLTTNDLRLPKRFYLQLPDMLRSKTSVPAILDYAKHNQVLLNYHQVKLMHLAIQYARMDVVAHLLQNTETRKDRLFESDGEGNTALHWAALTASTRAMKTLLGFVEWRAALLLMPNNDGDTPLHLVIKAAVAEAQKYNFKDIFQLRCEAIQLLLTQLQTLQLNQQGWQQPNKRGETPLAMLQQASKTYASLKKFLPGPLPQASSLSSSTTTGAGGQKPPERAGQALPTVAR